MSRIARAVVPALFVLLPALAACGSTTADQPPATTAGPATTSQLPREQAEEICSVKDSAGTYFLKITSYGDGDLSACAGGTQFKGDLDTLINMPTVDRRCIISPPKGPYRAIVGVYMNPPRVPDARQTTERTTVTDDYTGLIDQFPSEVTSTIAGWSR